MTPTQTRAHGLGVRADCEMCCLHEVRESHMRSQIAELDRQLLVAAEIEDGSRKREDWLWLTIFALALVVAYFVAGALPK